MGECVLGFHCRILGTHHLLRQSLKLMGKQSLGWISYQHILTIEDPIEFVHESKKCLVNQTERGAAPAEIASFSG